jgi:hypothetical protein
MKEACSSCETSTRFQLENIKRTDRLKDLGVNGNVILKWIFKKLWYDGSGLIWFWIRTSGGFL